MTEVRAMVALANDYLTERRQLGFDLSIQGSQIKAFARFADESGHTGPLNRDRSRLGKGKGEACGPLLLGAAARNPSSIRQISGGAGSGHRVSEDGRLWRGTPAARATYLFR
jgi:hypothetical protein